MGDLEAKYVEDAFATNWIAPMGPHLSAFETEFADAVGAAHAVAVSSGTAALHLALLLSGVGPEDEVMCSTLTFVASVNPILQLGATPVLIDSEAQSWNLDPFLLQQFLEKRARDGQLPKALVLVHLYGQSADLDSVAETCAAFGVILIEDAAEALGATYFSRRLPEGKTETLKSEKLKTLDSGKRKEGQSAESNLQESSGALTVVPGTVGRFGIYSFNGNKIITTSGGGMLVTADTELADRARFLSTQARDPAPHYQHSVAGYNYRMSNVLAGIGRGQLAVLPDRVDARRRNFAFYEENLSNLPGVEFMPEAPWGRCTRWLTCLTINPEHSGGVTREEVRLALEKEDIEARPVWKPMHQQPLLAGVETVGGAVSDQLFAHGLCLPSGSNLTEDDLRRVIHLVQKCWKGSPQ